MDEKTQFQAILSEFYRRLSLDPVCRAALKKIEAGTADFSDTAAFSGRASELLGEVFGASVLDMDEEARETVCMALLKERYSEMNDILEDVQTALDEPLGIHLTPQKAPFPAERVQQLAHSLRDPGAKPETIQRRANTGTANVAKSFHDDFIKTNAKLRSDLGLKPVIQRIASGKACPWCLEVAGKFRFGDQPDGVFRRHDSCNCTIIYDTQVMRGKLDENGKRSKTWEEVDPVKVMAEAWEPVRFSQSEAENLQNSLLAGLTKPGQGDIMNTGRKMAAPLQAPPDFSLYEIKDDPTAVSKMKTIMSETLGIDSGKIDLTGIKNAEVLEPFVKRLQKIKKDTEMTFPAIRALEIIDGDPTCIAQFKPYENTLYLSSKYFNSLEATIATLKEWSSKDILPKQAKNIAYLAEHETAHIRIPDELLMSDEAKQIFKKRKLTNMNDRDIFEYFADAVAIFRLNPNSADSGIIKAIEYLQNGGVKI